MFDSLAMNYDMFCEMSHDSFVDYDQKFDISKAVPNSDRNEIDPNTVMNAIAGVAGILLAGVTLFAAIKGIKENKDRPQFGMNGVGPVPVEYVPPVIQPEPVYYQQNIPQPTYQPAPVYQPPVVQPPVYVQPQPVYQAPQPVVQPTPYVSEYPWGYNAYIGAIANTPLQPAQTYYPVQNQPVYDMSQQGCMYETDYGRNRTVLQSSFGGRGPSIIVEHNQPQSGYAAPTQPQPQQQINSQYYQAYQYPPTDVKYTQPTQYNFQNYQYTYPSQTYSTKQTISPQLQPTIVSDRPVVPQYQPSTGIPKGISYLKEREILKNSYARTYPDGSRSFFKIPACYDDQGIWRGWNNQHGG
jgi:hypothetical protein